MESVVVIVDSESELQERFEFFVNLIGIERIEKTLCSRDSARIESDDYTIRFVLKQTSIRGLRCDHLFNLAQDIEFHNICALPIVRGSQFNRR